MVNHRTWDEVIAETRTKITSPTPISHICTLINVNYPKFKRLADEGILEYVDTMEPFKGPSQKRYKATRGEVKNE